MLKTLDNLFKRIHLQRDDVLLVRTHDDLEPQFIKVFYDYVRMYLKDGTLAILGDCELNTQAHQHPYLKQINTQERLILSSPKMLQILGMDKQSYFVYHPSIMMGSVGKYAKYLSRAMTVDFPYGQESVFQELYDLDAKLIFIDANHTLYEAKYALSEDQDKVIFKNASVMQGEIVDYLDFQCDYDLLHQLVFSNGLLLYEEVDGHIVYGCSYREYIDYLRAKIIE